MGQGLQVVWSNGSVYFDNASGWRKVVKSGTEVGLASSSSAPYGHHRTAVIGNDIGHQALWLLAFLLFNK